MNNVVCFILAGGAGSRLRPLTNERAKPAVPFGKLRIIDFAIAALVNGGAQQLYVVTQYAPDSLIQHINTFWSTILGFNRSIMTVQPKQRNEDEKQFSGTACAVRQNWNYVQHSKVHTDHVAIFSGDHIYVMNFAQMLNYHIEQESAFTVAAVRVRREEAANSFGVFEIDKDFRIRSFVEKPPLAYVPGIPNDPDYCYASMGNYLAKAGTMEAALMRDAENPESSHDFGKDIIPALLHDGEPVYAYPFEQDSTPGQRAPYWRDVGTLASYYATLNTMLEFEPPINLSNPEYPIPSAPDNLPPGRAVGENTVQIHTQVSGGAVIDDAELRWCSVGRASYVGKGAVLNSCHIGDFVRVGQSVHLFRVICDRHVQIPSGTEIGYNRDHDKARGFTTVDLDEHGTWLTVIPKGYTFR